MARPIHTRWKVSGILTAETAIHVGGMGGDADTDLALAINGRGEYYIPGTSLAGALRGWMSKPFSAEDNPQDNTDSLKNPKHPVNQLWGFQNNEQGHASFIVINDAQINLNGMTIEIREGVGIDRHYGAAADGVKYSRAILPKGVNFPLKITLDCQTDQNPDELWQLLLALEKSDIRIGAAKTRGLGKVKLNISSIHEQKLDAQNIFDVLLEGGKKRSWNELKPTEYASPEQLTLDIAWKPKDPVMVKTEGDGIAVDILPLVSQVDSKIRFVIPGSSIKGVLRAHAERIVRTVCQKDTGNNFLQQVQLNLINEIFGAASRSEQDLGLIGSLSIDDCYAAISMNPGDWSAVENATSMAVDDLKPLVNSAINKTDEHYRTLQPAMHVAVDRWTGGAADGMLYSVLEPIGVEWEKIGLQLDVERLKRWDEIQKDKDPNYKEQLQPAIALLLLVLRDFANRKIPIGYGTNRGMGTVEVESMEIQGLDGVEDGSAIAPDLSNLGDDLLLDLTLIWQNWIAQNKKVK